MRNAPQVSGDTPQSHPHHACDSDGGDSDSVEGPATMNTFLTVILIWMGSRQVD